MQHVCSNQAQANIQGEISMALLEVERVSKNFGGLAALTGVEVEVSDSELLGIIGPNGAGKSTLFNVITGIYQADGGSILFEGEDITRLRPDQIARRGIAMTFQQSLLYMRATCFDNVLMGFHARYKQPKWKDFLQTRAAQEEDEVVRQEVMEILEFWGLASLRDELALNLPHGSQRALGICIALATKPKLVLLDEPFTGMTLTETATMMEKVRQLRDRGITVVTVEHNMRAIMGLCERIVVLNFGQKIAEGSPQEIRENAEVIEAYLGREEQHAA